MAALLNYIQELQKKAMFCENFNKSKKLYRELISQLTKSVRNLLVIREGPNSNYIGVPKTIIVRLESLILTGNPFL